MPKINGKTFKKISSVSSAVVDISLYMLTLQLFTTQKKQIIILASFL